MIFYGQNSGPRCEVPSDFSLSHSVEDTYSSPRQHAVKVWYAFVCTYVYVLTSCVKCSKKNGVKIVSGALLPNMHNIGTIQ